MTQGDQKAYKDDFVKYDLMTKRKSLNSSPILIAKCNFYATTKSFSDLIKLKIILYSEYLVQCIVIAIVTRKKHKY